MIISIDAKKFDKIKHPFMIYIESFLRRLNKVEIEGSFFNRIKVIHVKSTGNSILNDE